MIKFKDLMESLTPPGNYVSINVKDFPNVEWLKGGKNINPDAAHVTLMYSKNTSVPVEEVRKLIVDPGVIKVKGTKLATFDSQEDDNLCCLVLKVESDELTEMHESLKDIGLVHSYANFEPHVTLVYDIPKDQAQEYINTVNPDSFGDIELEGINCDVCKKGWANDLK